MPDLRDQIQNALQAFNSQPLRKAALALLDTLGYRSDRTLVLEGSKPKAFLDLVKSQSGSAKFDETKALFSDWKSADILFQLTDQEISSIQQSDFFNDADVKSGLLRSYLFLAIELKGSDYARGKLSAIARQINRVFPMPVMVLLKHAEKLSIAVINRRQNKVHADKDVLEKVTLIRDIVLATPHRGHVDILQSFALSELEHPKKLPIRDFDTLHAAWEQIFNIELLNNRFYKELSNWYFWALPQVDFPDDLEKDAEKRRATGLIRLLTRLIFCWFLKEKDGLIPGNLFDKEELEKILNGFDPESETSSTYYQAILQNLFFATLNQRMGKDSKGNPYRTFATDDGFQKNRATYDINNLYRYENLFAVSQEEAIALFADIPFLNGGLFECLDRTEDGTNKKLYLDGFSRRKEKRPHVPDRLFFDSGETADLSAAYGDKKRKKEQVTGLISILNRYKFTIVENTPIDQEIALDPELLGKVFENLLASYNEETKTTARKQTGSFYTPRPIVDYMVDESLKAHLSRALVEKAGMQEEDARAGLDILFAYTEKEHAFEAPEVATLIAAIDEVKILDPACGSGAFPMGVLHKLVYILGKLDEKNEKWEQIRIDEAQKISDADERRRRISEIMSNFADNNDDYGRKLYLIENCLYGVDIQPIAIQITKLRFFISLVCDQKTNRNKKENHGIRPLPNLETKFVAADTLIGLPEMTQSLLVEPRVGIIEKEIESLYHSHFSEQNRTKKLANQRKVKSLRQELGKLLAESLMAPKKAQHVAEWDPFDPQTTADFFDPHWMFGRSLTSGFDVVLGNPPYIGESGHKELFRRTKDGFLGEFYMGKMDYFYFFFHVALKHTKPSGCVAFITTNYFMTASGARKLRSEIERVATVERLVNFGELKIFEAALGQHNLVTIMSKRKAAVFAKTCETKRVGMADAETLGAILSWSDSATEYFDVAQSDLFDGENRYIRLSYQSIRQAGSRLPMSAILDLVALNGKTLGSVANINQGVVSGCDYVSKQNIERLRDGAGIQPKDGIFVFDYENPRDKAQLSGFSGTEMALLRRFYKNSDIEKYRSEDQTSKRLLYIGRDTRDLRHYPEVLRHLSRFKDILNERREVQNGVIEFFQLQWPRQEDIFSGPKIVLPYRSNDCCFAYNEIEWFCRSDCYVITRPIAKYDLHFLLAFLNSQVCYCWLYHRGKRKGKMLEVFQTPLSEIPIPNTTSEVRLTLGALARLRCLSHRGESAAAFLEDLIDACVMECYFHEHMAERDLLFHELVAPHLAAHDPAASEAQQRDFLTHLHATLNVPSHPIRQRLDRICTDSPDLLAVIKQEGKV